MKTILIATDFSKNAENTLKYGIALAKKEKCRIVLLYAWQIVYPAADMTVLFETALNTIKQLKLLSLKVNKCYKVPCKFISKRGTAVDVILESIEKLDADLVIMGAKHAGSKFDEQGENKTTLVIRKAKCPVLAIPKEAVYRQFRRITYATNYQTADVDTVKKVADIAKKFSADITLLHIADENKSPERAHRILYEFSEKVKEKADYSKITTYLVRGHCVGTKLDEYASKKQADMLVMSTLNHKHRDEVHKGSLSEKIAIQTKMPLMVYHHRQNEFMFV